MKKLLLVFCSTVLSLGLYSQLLNPSFEAWSTVSWDELDSASSSNREALRNGLSPDVKSSIAQSGASAIYLQSRLSIKGDTAFDYVIYGDIDDGGPKRGMPYTQTPTSIDGFYQSDLMPGDTAGILVIFWVAGIPEQNMFTLYGTHSTYTPFSFPISLSGTPDSVIVAFVSSNPFVKPSYAKPGGWILIDNFTFGGSGVTQQLPNNDFENWSKVSFEDPSGWYTNNGDLFSGMGMTYAEKTTDAYEGAYALKITSYWIDDWNSLLAHVSNIPQSNNNKYGGAPFSNMVDTLCGYYKYAPSGQDTANIYLNFTLNSTNVYGTGTLLNAAATYTYFEIPIDVGQASDTVQIGIQASKWNGDQTNAGSVLYIDALQFKSKPLGIQPFGKKLFGSTAYPNPANDNLKINYSLEETKNIELTVIDVMGKVVFSKDYGKQNSGLNTLSLNTSTFAKGIYVYTIKTSGSIFSTNRFTVE